MELHLALSLHHLLEWLAAATSPLLRSTQPASHFIVTILLITSSHEKEQEKKRKDDDTLSSREGATNDSEKLGKFDLKFPIYYCQSSHSDDWLEIYDFRGQGGAAGGAVVEMEKKIVT